MAKLSDWIEFGLSKLPKVNAGKLTSVVRTAGWILTILELVATRQPNQLAKVVGSRWLANTIVRASSKVLVDSKEVLK